MNLAERGRMIRERNRRHHAAPVSRARVLPKNDAIRGDLAHPSVPARFPASGGSVEWPLDAFTLRRVRDGDVVIEGDAPVRSAPSARCRGRRWWRGLWCRQQRQLGR
jgi:hypothetical protein